MCPCNVVIPFQLEFERRKPDGTTTLGLLNPPADAHPGEMGYSHTHLGLAASRLQAGVNSLHGFKEDKRNKVTPGENRPDRSGLPKTW
ncbi:hypothetical protein FKM82_028511 [Ascaphus truei]